MEKKLNKKYLIISILVLAVFTATPIFAQNHKNTEVEAIITKADKEINLRIKSLNDLITRIDSMEKVSDSQQNSLTSLVQNEINQLVSLKTKIDSDIDLVTAKADYQSITKSYRIYALILPQIQIMAASDRVLTIVDLMNNIGNKVELRISELKDEDTTKMNDLLSDFKTKVSDANIKANDAIKEVSLLTPDQGDKTQMQANTTALKNARVKIKTATNDLITARKDINTIVQDLKELNNKKAVE